MRYLLREVPDTICVTNGIKVKTAYLIFDPFLEHYAIQRGTRFFIVKDDKHGKPIEEEISEKRFHDICETTDKQVEKILINQNGITIDFYLGEFMGLSVLEVKDDNIPEWIKTCIDRQTIIDDRQLILRQYIKP